jgi:undecaprenyl-diphosphatase
MSTRRSAVVRVVWTILFLAVIVGLAAYALIPQSGKFHAGLAALVRAEPRYVVCALAGWMATFCLAAFIYTRLALKQLQYLPTLSVEIAAGFANRLLPAGAGNLGLHGLYLVRQRHTVAAATVVVGVNNLLGITGHLLLLGVVLLFGRESVSPVALHFSPLVALVAAGFVALIVCGIFLVPWLRRKLQGVFCSLAQNLHYYARRPGRIVQVLGLAMVLTIIYTAVLYACCRAVGVDLSPAAIFLTFSAGMLGSTISPTPGGLVGAEAGLFAGLTLYQVAPSAALAAVLLYRLITYWLPLLPGSIALVAIRRQRLI